MALSGPPWTRRLACWSPARPCRPRSSGTSTGSFQMAERHGRGLPLDGAPARARPMFSETRRAVTGSALLAADHTQVGAPRSHGIGVLAPDHAGDLNDVVHVVRQPRGQELTEGDRAEARMRAAALQVRLGELEGGEVAQARAAEH